MDRLKLTEHRFRLDEVLVLTRGLSLKKLTNWCEHDLVKPKIVLRKRFFSALSIAGLQTMIDLGALGVPPADARLIADKIVRHAVYLHDVYPAKLQNGVLNWSLAGDRPDLHHIGYVFQYGGKHRIVICEPGENLDEARSMLPDFYIVVQVDSLCLTVFNRIYAHVAGVDLPDTTGVDTDLADFVKNISNPGDKR